MLARRYFVSGDVQGVGFRYFVLREVQHIGGIDGFVRNLYDGRVEVFAQSEEQQLLQLETALRRGPRSGRVSEVRIVEEAVDGSYSDFRIAMTSR